MKVIACFLGLLLWLGPYICADDFASAADDDAMSGCVQCHTDVRRLIRLSWEVERVRGKPAVSALTEGEG